MPTHDIDVRRIAWVGATFGAVVVVVVITVILLLKAWGLPARTDRVRLPYQPGVPGPAFQSAPQLDLAQERAAKQRVLENGARIDEHTARIPIATAMDLLANPPATAASAAEARP